MLYSEKFFMEKKCISTNSIIDRISIALIFNLKFYLTVYHCKYTPLVLSITG